MSPIVQLQEGDMVIMVSDGVLDSFYEKYRANSGGDGDLIDRLSAKMQIAWANQVLMNTLAHSTKEASDNMQRFGGSNLKIKFDEKKKPLLRG